MKLPTIPPRIYQLPASSAFQRGYQYIVKTWKEKRFTKECRQKFSMCLGCELKNKCDRYSNHRKSGDWRT